jgi:phenylalanyl-tRNA synthetase beta chain
MKISYNWLRQYINTSLTSNEVAELLTASGLEVESVEQVEAVKGGLKGVVIGEVLDCEKHPDADRLRLTKVDIGQGEPLQIVCGAPNVAKGQKVLVATIGTKLFPSEGEPLVIKKGKIRGQESNGMICAEDELGIGKSHDGILVLDASARVGADAASWLGLSNDECLEIGLTPNRTDAFSHVGVARDLYAVMRNMKGIKSDAAVLQYPDTTNFKSGASGEAVKVLVKHHQAAPRYAGITINGVLVGESPKWLKDRLLSIGLRPINNVVDVTNFVQHELGQPLHAFDVAKMEGREIHVRLAHAGEKFTTLDGIERTLQAEDLVIADRSKAACIAGVFGGADSGVTESTKEIFLESAFFHPVYVRKTAKRLGLHTDASFRFERGCDPNQVIVALKRAALLIAELAGGIVVGDIVDEYPEKVQPSLVSFSWSRCASLIGKDLGKETIKSILHDLEIEIKSEDDDGLQLSVPLYRSDVKREADVVEEILRIYGYDNIEFPKGLKSSLSYAPKPDPEKNRNVISDMLSSSGFMEMMSMSLTRQSYLGFDQTQESSVVQLLNPLSGDLGVMRQTLLYGGLEAIALNQNHRNPDLRMYEFGKVYHSIEGKFKEEYRLAIFITGRRFPESWNNVNDLVSFADARAAADKIFAAAGIDKIQFSSNESALFHESVACGSGKSSLGIIGDVHTSLLKKFDIKQPVFFAEFSWDAMMKLWPKSKGQYKEPEKFPAVRRDLSLLVDKSVMYGDIEKVAFESERKLLRGVNLFDVYEGKNLDDDKKSYAVSFILQEPTKTLTDQIVDAAMGRILKQIQEKLGATLRG